MHLDRIRVLFLVLLVVFGLGPMQPVLAQDLDDILRQHDPTGDAAPDPAQNTPLVLSNPSPGPSAAAPAAGTAEFGVAVMSDLHVCKDDLATLRQAVEATNDLPGISAVALTGDICHTVASPDQLQLAADLVEKFSDPVWAVPGNHDFMYQDKVGPEGKKSRGSAAQKKAKLEKFRVAMKQKAIRFAKKVGGHLLVFLPIDALAEKPLACLSATTLTFFRETLDKNPKVPTIVFCHAPLEGSYDRETDLGPTNANAQPARKIRDILQDNPQVFLWVAGHLHIRPSSADFHAKTNKVDGVTGIHVPNVPDASAWILTLKLSPDAAVVRTYDVKARKFLAKHDRTFRHKAKPDAPTVTPPTPPQPPSVPPSQKELLERLERMLKKLEALLAKLLKFGSK